MNTTQYKTEQEIQQLGMEVLHKGLGVSDFIRFDKKHKAPYSLV